MQLEIGEPCSCHMQMLIKCIDSLAQQKNFPAINMGRSPAITGQILQYYSNNFQRHAPPAGSIRRRPAARNRPSSSASRAVSYCPPATSSSISSAKNQIFIAKVIVLIRSQNEENTIRPPKKTALISSCSILGDLKIDKNWSEREVMSHLHKLFETKVSVGERPVR